MNRPNVESIKRNIKDGIKFNIPAAIEQLVGYIEYLESQQSEQVLTPEQLKLRMKEIRENKE